MLAIVCNRHLLETIALCSITITDMWLEHFALLLHACMCLSSCSYVCMLLLQAVAEGARAGGLDF